MGSRKKIGRLEKLVLWGLLKLMILTGENREDDFTQNHPTKNHAFQNSKKRRII